jgi:hypothetical protein
MEKKKGLFGNDNKFIFILCKREASREFEIRFKNLPKRRRCETGIYEKM